MSLRAWTWREVVLAAALALGAVLLAPASLAQEPVPSTGLKVLVRADDAKFIGSGVGGLNILVRDTATGELLAQGAITGLTGATEALMQTPQTRGRSATVGDPASFQAELAIARPTRIEVSVTGPLAVPQSIQATSTSLWLIPGQDRVEHPVILHLPGLITDVSGLSVDQRSLALTASVTMICGCPVSEDGLWRAADFRVAVQLYRAGELLAEAPLAFTGTDNEFAGKLDLPGPGDFDMLVYAYQLSTGNAGVYERPLRVD